MARKKTSDEIHAGETKFVASCDLAKSLAVSFVIAFLGYHFIVMMREALLADPDTLTAFAKFISEWKLSQIILAISTAICGGGWCIEHYRNNHLVKRNGDMRHEKESCDVVRTRSGLDEMGRTPKGE